MCFKDSVIFLMTPKGYFSLNKMYVQDPDKAVVQVRVDRLHVVQSDGFTQQLFVER